MEIKHLFRLLKYIRQRWYLLPVILVSMVSATLLGLAPPWLTGVVLIDRVIVGKETSLLLWVVLGLLGAIVLRQGFDLAQRYFLAHRLSSLRYASRVEVLEGGKIGEEGSHRELLARPGLYRRLHQLQSLEEMTLLPQV